MHRRHVGGGFGSKISLYGKETAIVFASKLLTRPIKWSSSRSEAVLSDAQGRDRWPASTPRPRSGAAWITHPAGTYTRDVEVDPLTGHTRIDRMTACDDFGNVINPMIVEGQVHGGLAQGIGQALLEHGVYDTETGQLPTGSYMDCAMPRADDRPSFTVETAKGTPCTHNPLG